MTKQSGKRKPNGRSSIYYSESDGKWHGWVTMGREARWSPRPQAPQGRHGGRSHAQGSRAGGQARRGQDQ
ncbi:hypothetical protein Acsp04_60950 [Actinomadura sp. NBRC 104425]|nr:hypothetical protein Acsp04_60950 [Actinomadura sp. NBRC 104425]